MSEGKSELAIRARGLAKRYGDNQAVDGFDLEVKAGETFALLGPNGAGKTTAVEIMEGFRRADAGEVRVLGVDPAENSRQWRDRVGIVPQGTGSFKDLRVSEVVTHFATFYSRPLAAADVIEMVGLSAKADDLCKNLSGGQRRRVDVALALVGDPELIFLDEPTTGLDPDARRQAWDLVKVLAAQGKTTLLTTHYMEEAEVLADRVGIIVAGKMVAVGTAAEIGGRSEARATVSFERTAALEGIDLPILAASTRVESAGRRVVISTDDATDATFRLITWAREHGEASLPALAVLQPTLEQVYLGMVNNVSGASGSEATSDKGAS